MWHVVGSKHLHALGVVLLVYGVLLCDDLRTVAVVYERLHKTDALQCVGLAAIALEKQL